MKIFWTPQTAKGPSRTLRGTPVYDFRIKHGRRSRNVFKHLALAHATCARASCVRESAMFFLRRVRSVPARDARSRFRPSELFFQRHVHGKFKHQKCHHFKNNGNTALQFGKGKRFWFFVFQRNCGIFTQLVTLLATFEM